MTAPQENSKPDPKIIDLINARGEDEVPFTSLEFFPPRTEEGVTVRTYVPMNLAVKTLLH